MAERRKCYKILGLEYGATEDEVRKAYKKLALQFHPDKNDSESAKEKFQEIGYAYKYLTEGPNSISTSDPHDLREEFLRKLFEDLFLPRFHGHNFFGGGGGFAFFFADDDADDDNYDYYGGFHHHSDSSDSNSYRSRPSSSHYNRGSSQTWSSSIYHQTSAKQQKRKEKKQRQKERAKEKKRKEREENTKSESVYTDDIATDNNQTESSSRKQSLTSNNEENKNSTKPNQQTKLNKKEKKKLESEQRKREKEMEEIAEELMKKEAQDLEKMKEKEKQAAKKLEEEEESSFIPQFYAQKEKKSRKARQREKKRQEAAELQERIDNARNVSSSSASASSVYTQNTQTNITSSSSGKHNGTTKPSTQSKQTPLSTRHSSVKVEKGRQNLTQKKAGVMGSRFDVLENLIDSDVGSSDDHETFVGETLTFSHDYRSDNKDYDDENEDDDDDDNDDDDDDENGDNDDIEDDDESDNVEKIDKDRKASNFNERGNSELHDFKTRPNSHDYKQVSSGYDNDYYHDNLYTGYGRSRGFTPSFASRNGFVRQGFHGPNIHPRFPAPNNYQYSRGPPPPPPPQSRFHDPNIHPRSLDPNNFQYFRGTPPPPPPQSRYPIHSYENMRPPYPNPGYGYPDPRYGYPHNQPFRYNSSYHTSFSPHRDREFSGKRNTSYSDVPYNSKFAPSDEKRNFDTHNAYSQFNRKFESDTKIGGKKSQYSGGHKTNETFSATSKNMFQTYDDINQVPSSTKDVFDSLDDIEDSSDFKNPVVKERLSNWSDIDDGYDQLLSSDKLGVPKGMFNDKIKNYYK